MPPLNNFGGKFFYILKENNMTSLVTAQYNEENELIYKGHVTLKLNQYKYKKASSPPIKYVPSGSNNEDAVWLETTLVCTTPLYMAQYHFLTLSIIFKNMLMFL